jgi:hypothetical protein
VSKQASAPARAQAGDTVVITGHRVGEAQRSGEILEVLGEPRHERYRVRWHDGHESVVSPGSDALIQHMTPKRKSGRKTSSRAGG